MQMVTIQVLQWLVGSWRPPCVSIYLPTHRHHPGIEQDRIRLKNLLRQAASLLQRQYREQDVGQLLAPAEELSTGEFWHSQQDGLAVFCSPEVQVHYRLPASVPEIVVVADSFHTKPLVSYLSSNRHYFVLSLSQNAVKLYEGTPHVLGEIDLESLPQGLRELLGDQRSRPFLTTHGGGGGGKPSIHHGHGPGDEDRKREIAKYFRAIDRALWPFLRDERAPLVLAGVRYYHSMFQAASRYPNVLEEGVAGNVDRMSVDDLRAAVWPLVARQLAEEEEELFEQLGQALAAGRASKDLPEIARAVAHGRVRVLVHETGKTVWGTVDGDTGEVTVHEQQRGADDADIIDDLCEMTLLRGGEVFEVGPHGLLRESPVAALFRY